MNYRNLFPLITNLGLEKLLPGRSLVNVYFHGVAREQSKKNTSIENLKRYFKYFKDNFDVVDIYTALDIWREGRKLKRKTISISFDDGYRNLNFAMLTIDRYQLPVTIFLTAGGLFTPYHMEGERLASHFHLKNWAKNPLITIGSHSVSHPDLTRISRNEAIYEMTASRYIIQSVIKKPVDVFCFPFGSVPDYLVSDYPHYVGCKPQPGVLPRQMCISNTTTVESNLIRLQSKFINGI